MSDKQFMREDRYIVIKRSDMEKLPHDVRRNFSGRCRSFYEQMLIAGAPARSFLVIESDWPEYEPVWQMIERRVSQPSAHLTIPGALEWDGDNGTHGVVGTHGADGESMASHSGGANEKAEPVAIIGRDWSLLWFSPAGMETHAALCERTGLEIGDKLYRAQPAPVSAYTAVDMTTAAAGGFRDGQTAANDSLKAFASEMIAAAFEGGSFDGGDIQDIAVKHGLMRIEQRTEECGEVCACREYGFPAECYRKTDLLKPADPAKCESCGGWGHIETEDSAHDCPECGPSVIERAVEAGVMNAPKPYVAMTEAEADEFLSSFGGGSGNKAKRRIAAMEEAKQKPCTACDGWGTISTGIDEAPSTNCKKCDGTGKGGEQ